MAGHIGVAIYSNTDAQAPADGHPGLPNLLLGSGIKTISGGLNIGYHRISLGLGAPLVIGEKYWAAIAYQNIVPTPGGFFMVPVENNYDPYLKVCIFSENVLIHNSSGLITQPEFVLASPQTTIPEDINGNPPTPAAAYNRAFNFWFRIEDINSSVGGPGPTGPQGPQGPAGTTSSGAMSVSFSQLLRGQPTKWGTGQEPPGPLVVQTVENYTLINNTLGGSPQLNLKEFEFLQVAAMANNIPSGGIGINSGAAWPSIPYDSYITSALPTINGITWNGSNGGNTLGPINTNTNINNFYGYRIPYDGVLLGFSVDFCEKPTNGIFNVFYWNPAGNRTCLFCTGGPIIGQGNNTGYASGNTVFSVRNEVEIKRNGYLFAAQDLSYIPGGTNVGLVNNWLGGAAGLTHITAFLKFNST